MGRGVGRREGDRNDKICSNEPEEDKNKKLPFPSREQSLKHRDRALTVRTFFSDSAVDRQCSEEREKHKDEGCDRR